MSNMAYLKLLVSYLPPLVTRHVAAQPDFTAPIPATSFPAAVLFADISGFVALTERLAERGPAGAETLTDILNAYFAQLIDVIAGHGGEVVKFAGDGLLALWPAAIDGGDALPALPQAVTLAAQCGLRVQSVMRQFQSAEGVALALRVGVGAGQVTWSYVGGIDGRWEFLLAGAPLADMGRAEEAAAPGEVVLAPAAYEAVAAVATGTALPGGFWHLTGVQSAVLQPRHRPVPLRPEMAAGLEACLPLALRGRLAAGQTGWLAELRQVTILFLNLPNSSLAEIQAIVPVLQAILSRFEGSLNKLNVDEKGVSLLAAFGLPPLAHEDDPRRALEAALALAVHLQPTELTYSVGVATGRVFCGSVGSPARREYTMIGAVVNLAARLMQTAVPAGANHIVCDEATFRAASAHITFDDLGAVQVRGREAPVPIFRPLGRKTAQRRLTTQLVGRSDEAARFRQALADLRDGGQTRVIVVEGEAGMGKSCLALAAGDEAPQFGVTTVVVTASAIERSTPYFAWRLLLGQILQLDPESHDQAEALARAWLGGDESLLRLAPLLNDLLNLDIPDNAFTAEMSGQVRADNIQELAVFLLNQAAQTAPHMLLLDDAQWLDSASWALLGAVFERVPALLLVVACRPLIDETPATFERLLAAESTQLIRLGLLRPADSVAIACHRLGVTELPPAIDEFIQNRAEGHPFLSEELAYALRDEGVVEVVDGRARLGEAAAEGAQFDFPDSLQGVITGRIDRLAPQPQLTLKVASVIGRIFGYNTLHDVHPIDDDRPRLRTYLDVLEQLDLTPLEAPEPELRYVFKHLLTQEVAYNLMSFSQRRQLHQAVARWYEDHHADDIQGYYPLLAHHWTHADARQEAIRYLEKAGEQAFTSYANQEAIRFFGDALALAEEWDGRFPARPAAVTDIHARRARWLRFLGNALVDQGKLVEAYPHLEQAIRLLGFYLPRSTPGWVVRLLREAGRQAWHRLRPRPGRSGPSPLTRTLHEAARLYEIRGASSFVSGELLQFFCLLLVALNLAERVPPSRELALSYANVANVAGAVPLHGLARNYVRLAIETARKVNQLSTTAIVYSRVSVYLAGVADWHQAESLLQESFTLADQLGDRRQWTETASILNNAQYYQGQYQQCADRCLAVVDTARRSGNILFALMGLSGLAESNVRLGELDAAARYAQESLDLLAQEPLDAVSNELSAHSVLGIVNTLQGNIAAAWEHTAVAVDLIRRHPLMGPLSIIGTMLTMRASLLLYQLDEAASAGERKTLVVGALKGLRRNARTFPVARPLTQIYEGYYLWLRGRGRKAEQRWEQGLAQARRLQMPYEELVVYTIRAQVSRAAGAPALAEHLQAKAAQILADLSLRQSLLAGKGLL